MIVKGCIQLNEFLYTDREQQMLTMVYKEATPCDTVVVPVAVTVVCLAAVDVEVCGFVCGCDPDHFLRLTRL